MIRVLQFVVRSAATIAMLYFVFGETGPVTTSFLALIAISIELRELKR